MEPLNTFWHNLRSSAKNLITYLAISILVTMKPQLCDCRDGFGNNSFPVSGERRLVTDLLNRYKVYGKEARPLFNSSEKVVINMALRLMHLEMDEKEQTMKTSVWKIIGWTDEYLKWNPDDYEGLENIILPMDQIWHPDIGLVNTATPTKEERSVELQVFPEGYVLWVPQAVYYSACLMDLTNYPYDQHTCDMWFQCTTLFSSFVDLEPFPDISPMDISTFLDEYKKSTDWEILENTTKRVEQPRDEGVILMYSRRVALKFSLTLRRRPGFRSLLVTLPCVLLCLLTCVVFGIPPDQPERYTLGMSLFASFMILVLILTETAPPSAASVPRLAIYYRHNLLLVMSSVFVSIFVAKISKLGEQGRSVPHWVQVIFFRWLSVPLMMQDSVRSLKAANTPVNGAPSFSKPEQVERGPYGAVMTENFSKSGESSESERSPHHSATDKRQLTSQWRLVGSMLDRVCLCAYLLTSITLIAMYSSVMTW